MKSFLITGTSSGIGKYLGEKLSKANPVYGVSRNPANIRLNKEYLGDINDRLFLEELGKSIGPIDFLIINAGIGFFGEFEKISLSSHEETIKTNLLSPIQLIHILLENSKIKKGIIFIGSYAGKKSMSFGTSYMASKFGLRGFAMGLKNETGLKIHLINPKIVETNFHKNSSIDVSGIPQTGLQEILDVVENIISGTEKRFEIDL